MGRGWASDLRVAGGRARTPPQIRSSASRGRATISVATRNGQNASGLGVTVRAVGIPDRGRSARMATFRDAVTAAALGSGRAAAVLDAARAVTGELHGVVLVEGPSDRAAVEALAVGRGRDLLGDGVLVLDMGGATNVARFATVLEGIDLELRVAALCDQDQQSHYRRAFHRVRTGGGPVPAPAGPVGVFVCGQDLEDELKRTLRVAV